MTTTRAGVRAGVKKEPALGDSSAIGAVVGVVDVAPLAVKVEREAKDPRGKVVEVPPPAALRGHFKEPIPKVEKLPKMTSKAAGRKADPCSSEHDEGGPVAHGAPAAHGALAPPAGGAPGSVARCARAACARGGARADACARADARADACTRGGAAAFQGAAFQGAAAGQESAAVGAAGAGFQCAAAVGPGRGACWQRSPGRLLQLEAPPRAE